MNTQPKKETREQSIIMLSPKKAYEYAKTNAIIVDIRPEYEICFRVFDVPHVIYLDYNFYRENIDNLPHECLLIVADSVGIKSREVARFLLENGYDEVACLIGGIVEWDKEGLPLQKDADYEMVGGCACRLHPQKPKNEGSSVKPHKSL